MQDEPPTVTEWTPDMSKAEVTPVPSLYATNFMISISNDVTVALQKPTLLSLAGPGGQPIETIAMKTTGSLSLSIHAAKDLARLLSDNIAAYEKHMGKVDTLYLRSLSEQSEQSEDRENA